ncbi:hypothetical protein EON66_05180 [archaeon]|nr:MAG: hypothetical protein EON66_05180 [archaeon]
MHQGAAAGQASSGSDGTARSPARAASKPRFAPATPPAARYAAEGADADAGARDGASSMLTTPSKRGQPRAGLFDLSSVCTMLQCLCACVAGVVQQHRL